MSTNTPGQGGEPDKIWSGRFSVPIADSVKRYTSSVFFDHRLAEFDVQGSLAHARMLAHVGLLTTADLSDIERGLAQELDGEVHLTYEPAGVVCEIVMPVPGGKLHEHQ